MISQEIILAKLKEANASIKYPITINYTEGSNDASISCDYMGTGVHVNLSELNLRDFDPADEKFKLCRTWEAKF